MTRYLLDTNVISQATKPVPSTALLRWLAEQADEDLFISVLSLAEIWRGILEKSEAEGGASSKAGLPDRKDRRPCLPAASWRLRDAPP